jgi:hypothetical protein
MPQSGPIDNTSYGVRVKGRFYSLKM